MALLTHTAQVLQQMSILLKCCPSEKVSLQEWSPLPQSLLSALTMSSADDVLVTEVTQTLEVWTMSARYFMANSVSEQEEPNPARWLATRAGEMALSCPLGIIRCVPQKIVFFFHIINLLLTKLVRSRWLDIGLVLFFACLWFKELGQYQAILTSRLVNNPYILS